MSTSVPGLPAAALPAIKQGQIYWVRAKDLDIEGSEQQRNRPYLIVSRDIINTLGKNVVGVPLSTKLHKACAHRVLIPALLMVKNPAWPPLGSPWPPLETSVALTDHIRVLDSGRLAQPSMGSLAQTAVGGIELGLAFLLDIR